MTESLLEKMYEDQRDKVRSAISTLADSRVFRAQFENVMERVRVANELEHIEERITEQVLESLEGHYVDEEEVFNQLAGGTDAYAGEQLGEEVRDHQGVVHTDREGTTSQEGSGGRSDSHQERQETCGSLGSRSGDCAAERFDLLSKLVGFGMRKSILFIFAGYALMTLLLVRLCAVLG